MTATILPFIRPNKAIAPPPQGVEESWLVFKALCEARSADPALLTDPAFLAEMERAELAWIKAFQTWAAA